jgi:hypothetical protein
MQTCYRRHLINVITSPPIQVSEWMDLGSPLIDEAFSEFTNEVDEISPVPILSPATSRLPMPFKREPIIPLKTSGSTRIPQVFIRPEVSLAVIEIGLICIVWAQKSSVSVNKRTEIFCSLHFFHQLMLLID